MVKVKWNEETKDWLTLEAGSKEEGSIYLDGYLKSNLDFIRKDLRDDSDAVIVITGKERGGKSVFAMTVGKYIDPSLDLARVTFTPSEFRAAVLKAGKYECVIFDEAITGMRAQRWTSEVNQALVELLAQIGQKNLAVIIVIPSFFELGKYVAIHRSVALLHIYREAGQRGFFKAYNGDSKTTLYVLGKKSYDYNVVHPDFYGRFTNQYVIPDEAAYRAKKLQALMHPAKFESNALVKARAQRNKLIQILSKDFGVSTTKLVGYLEAWGVSRSQIYSVLDEGRAGLEGDEGGVL